MYSAICGAFSSICQPFTGSTLERQWREIETYLEKGDKIPISPEERERISPLHCAVSLGDLDLCKKLCALGADIKATSEHGTTPLDLAVYEGHVEIVKYFIENGADLYAIQSKGYNYIHIAAGKGNIALCSFLMEQGVSIHSITTPPAEEIGLTPLFYAILAKDLEMIKFLINHGASVNHRTASGETCLLFGLKHGNDESVKLLLKAGAPLNPKLPSGRTLLEDLIFSGSVELVRGVLDLHARFGIEGVASLLQQRGVLGRTPLHLAALYNQKEIVALLLERGADCTVLSDYLETPLSLARQGSDCYEQLLGKEHGLTSKALSIRLLGLRFSLQGLGLGFLPFEAALRDVLDSANKFLNEYKLLDHAYTLKQAIPLLSESIEKDENFYLENFCSKHLVIIPIQLPSHLIILGTDEQRIYLYDRENFFFRLA
jgi:ankyrin repeat protein